METACIDPNGENAGPNAAKSSGFGGLGLEGMVETEEEVGVGTTPPGEGKSGVISGDNSWKEEGGGFVKSIGGEEARVEALELSWEEREREGEAEKAMISTKWNQKEAIANDERYQYVA